MMVTFENKEMDVKYLLTADDDKGHNSRVIVGDDEVSKYLNPDGTTKVAGRFVIPDPNTENVANFLAEHIRRKSGSCGTTNEQYEELGKKADEDLKRLGL